MLFGSYRRGDANDPDAYVAAIAAVLSRYDSDLIREVTDPRTGIASTEKYMSFMPNAGELKCYCDGEAARRARIERSRELPPLVPIHSRLPPPRAPGRNANFFVPADHARYPALVVWSATAELGLWRMGKSSDGRDGIWIGRAIWEDFSTRVMHVEDAQ